MREAPVKLLIAITSGRGWCSRFGHKYGQLCFHLGRFGIPNADGKPLLERFALIVNHGAYLTIARNDHMLQARKQGFTHLLSLDDDMTFPANCVERMIAHEKAVVTCNYRQKVADESKFACSGEDGSMLSSLNKTGLEKLTGMGMGITLIDIERTMHVPPPFFEVLWDEEKQDYLIEDGVFSGLLRERYERVATVDVADVYRLKAR